MLSDLISHLLDPVVDPWSDRERQTMYEQITVPESYSGPHLTFPLTVSHTNALLSAFKEQQVPYHSIQTLFPPLCATGPVFLKCLRVVVLV